MKPALNEISTVAATFGEDLAAYAAAGFEGIGIWEMKLGDDDADVAALRASGLRATSCVPLVPSILPNAVVDGPTDVEERIASLCSSMHRLARYEPASVFCLTGPTGDLPEAEARRIVVDGLQRVAAAAADAGVRFGLEPIHVSQREQLSFVNTIPDAVALLEEAGLPDVGLLVDLWHVGDTPTIDDDLRAHAQRVTGLHVADHFPEPRPDRALPGTAGGRTRELVGVLSAAGWDGFLDVEIFGDPENPESFWSLPVEEAARRAYEAAVGVLP